MKLKYLKLKQWLLVSAMGALGLTGCQSHKKAIAPEGEPSVQPRMDEPARLMYGVPTMNYRVSGRVTDRRGHPVSDIRVNLLENGMEVENGTLQGDSAAVQHWLESTEVRTDKKGRFSLTNTGSPQHVVRLLVRDADGAKNGQYDNQVVSFPVDEENLDRTDAHGMSLGTFHQEVSVRMKKSEE